MQAPGRPGMEPRWTGGYKDGVGTAISPASPLWFTVSHGILNEVYYPRLDTAAIRDGELLVVDPDGRFFEEKRDLVHETAYADPEAPAFRIVNREPDGAFALEKRIVTWPRVPVLLQSITLHARRPDPHRIVYLLAPHLVNQGMGNSARVTALRDGTPAMIAWRAGIFLCMAARRPFASQSVGFVGVSDGWTLVHEGGPLTPYDAALDGNIACSGEWIARDGDRALLAIAFGRTESEALFGAELALEEDYEAIEAEYVGEWKAYFQGLGGLPAADTDHGRLGRVSAMVLKTHQDKIFSGGLIASLSIPWGNAVGDGNIGGYHLVWPRDMVEAANALVAIGDIDGARRAFRFLSATQNPDGSWPQNFWLDGTPYWSGSQLDETAFPIHLAWRLITGGHVAEDAAAYARILKALSYLVQHGPVTQEERWEEDGGYSPSTLAAMITALILGAELAERAGDGATAAYARAVADYWAASIERWTFTTEGSAVPDHPRHYERIHPVADVAEDGNIHHGYVPIKNLPGGQMLYPEVAVIDGGFLELVRYGIRPADDPAVVDSVAAYDAALKTDMPYGPVWHRYSHDGYGEPESGEPYTGNGKGRAWPLLTGERGHYALARGDDPTPYLDTMAATTTAGGLIPEQVWDAPDVPAHDLYFGRPTGSASPLVWAHAEFLKLLASARAGQVFECYPPVAARYARAPRPDVPERVFWQFNHQIATWAPGTRRIRVAVLAAARLVFTLDDWKTAESADLSPTPLGMYYADIDVSAAESLEFTFYWEDAGTWEGHNFRIMRQD